MQSELISVIIPVYNTKKYLDACLESIIHQTYQNLEIIIVDDGSTDDSGIRCDEWAKLDERIKVIHKENGGLGYARNTGLDAASGTYISFVDSDDTMNVQAYEKCINVINENRLDTCCFAKRIMNKKGNFTYTSDRPSQLLYENDQVQNQFACYFLGKLPNNRTVPFIMPTVCCFLYSRQIIEEYNIRFMSERECLSEDIFFNLDYLQFAKRVQIIEEFFYNYTYNNTSLTKSYKNDRLEKITNFYNLLVAYAKVYEHADEVTVRVMNFYVIYLRHYIEMETMSIETRGIIQTYSAIRKYCKDKTTIEVIQQYPHSRVDRKMKFFLAMVRYNCVVGLMLYYLFKKQAQ